MKSEKFHEFSKGERWSDISILTSHIFPPQAQATEQEFSLDDVEYFLFEGSWEMRRKVNMKS